MERLRSRSSSLADVAESLRQEGRLREAMEAVEQALQEDSNHLRSLLLRARIFYQQGQPLQAVEALHPLQSLMGQDRELKAIAAGLEELSRKRISQTDPAFVTEAMARLLVQQGYLLQAIEIYRQLFLAAEEKKDLWGEMISLRERLGREGSREMGQERLAQEIENLDRWIKKYERGS